VRRPDGREVYTNSELKTFKRCRRKWWLAYVQRLALLREDKVSAARLGTIVHLGLEAVYDESGRDPGAVIAERVREDVEALRQEAEANGWDAESKVAKVEKQGELARIMIEGYVEWLAEEGVNAGLTVIGAEETVEVPLDPTDTDGPWLLGKQDVRLHREEDDARLFLDGKTAASIEERERLAYLDEQFKHYHLIEYLKHLHEQSDAQRTDGALIDVLRKVKRTARSKPPFYGRIEVRHNVHALRSYWDRVVGTVEDIRRVEGALEQGESHHVVAYPNPTRDCTWDCPFLAICPMYDDGSDVESVIKFSYERRDPLTRYGADEDPDD
jgi:hypothetical protein